MSEEKEFEVGEHMLKGDYDKCMVCLENLKVGEKVILCPIQKPRKGFASVVSIPIHTKCYWLGED